VVVVVVVVVVVERVRLVGWWGGQSEWGRVAGVYEGEGAADHTGARCQIKAAAAHGRACPDHRPCDFLFRAGHKRANRRPPALRLRAGGLGVACFGRVWLGLSFDVAACE